MGKYPSYKPKKDLVKDLEMKIIQLRKENKKKGLMKYKYNLNFLKMQ